MPGKCPQSELFRVEADKEMTQVDNSAFKMPHAIINL